MNAVLPMGAMLPPYEKASNTEAEQQVLGALLLSVASLPEVKALGGRDLFLDPVHGEIFAAISDRARRNETVSPVALSTWARGYEQLEEIGGPSYLVRLAGAAIAPKQVRDYAELLADLLAKRRVLKASHEAVQSILQTDESSAVICGRLEASITALGATVGQKPVSMMAATTVALENAVEAMNGCNTSLVKTGIESLDNMIGGLRPGELVLLGGRPSMGKTSVSLNIALNAARAGHGVAICSLEMNPEQLAVRALSEQTGQDRQAVTYRDILNGNIDQRQLGAVTQAAKTIAELPIQFLPREFADLGAMIAGARQAKKLLGGNLRLLVIDYTQLLKSNARGRYEQITEISIALKALAGSLNIPILALSQLSRAVEQREDKRPMLSDLRESGQLEQDADAVLFCYRDEYYLEREQPDGDDAEAWDAYNAAVERSRNKLEIIVAKQRQGAIGTVRVMCNVALNRIWER